MAPKRTKAANTRLVALRKSLKLTQKTMAEKLGIGLRMYQNLEAGAEPNMSVAILIRLMREGTYR